MLGVYNVNTCTHILPITNLVLIISCMYTFQRPLLTMLYVTLGLYFKRARLLTTRYLQQYVPVVSEVIIPGVGVRQVHADNFHQYFFGGDQITAKRARGI